VRATDWTRGDVLLAGGGAIMLAAAAEAVWLLRARFAVDLAGLSTWERAAVALWDFRPVPLALCAGGAVLAYLGLREPAGRLASLHASARPLLAIVAAGGAALAFVVLLFAVWIAEQGAVGSSSGLGFAYPGSERLVTLLTQLAACVPLGLVLAVLAVRLTRVAPVSADEYEAAPAPRPESGSVGAEMDELWREQLAHGPRRARARALLARIHALEEAGDEAAARELAEEMRQL
jgi:hypothetical protein